MKNRTDSRQNRNIKDAKKKTTDKDNRMMIGIQKSANQWWQNKREKKFRKNHSDSQQFSNRNVCDRSQRKSVLI